MKERIRARGIDKRFPGVLALEDVDLTLYPGEVLAVVGENGAGKSTLMNVLAGVIPPDAGSLEIEGRKVRFAGVSEAQASGVALIHQELCLCERLSVAANICLGREARRFGMLDRPRNLERAAHALDRVGLEIDPRASLEDLSMGQRQGVEIAKAVDADASVLIMDEPTSSLSLAESERLFTLIAEVVAKGTSVIYISHRLSEVERLADRALVLRDGRVAGELDRDEIDHQRLVQRMVGRDVSRFYSRSPSVATGRTGATAVLEVTGLVTQQHPGHRVSFEVRAGEVVGLAGLVGAGRSELLRAISLLDRPLEGVVEIDGTALGPTASARGPATAIAAGIALVPEDRKEQGLFLPETVRGNLSIGQLSADAHLGFVDTEAEKRLSQRAIRETGIKTSRDSEAVTALSGGNQQKVVLARAFASDPKVLLLDEPTRGVDVGAKSEIYALIDQRARRGLGVLFASNEMEEILGLSDRCLVMHQGRLAGELAKAELSEEAVLLLATGAEQAA